MIRFLCFAALGFSASVGTLLSDQAIPMDGGAVALRYSKDGKSLVVVGEDRQLRVWDLATGKLNVIIQPQPEEVIVFLPATGTAYATITTNGAARIHDTETGGTIAHANLPTSVILGGAMASTMDGTRLAVAGGDPNTSSGNLIKILERSGKTRSQVTAGIGGVSAMAFSPDGSTLAAVAYDADVRIWSAETGTAQHVIDALQVAMFDTAFSPDGKYLATAGVDRTIYLWETQTWKLGRKITGQPETISVVRFSPDGTLLVTGGMNERNFNAPVKVILWDFASGRKLHAWTVDHAVRSLSFSPDNESVAVADGTQSVKLLVVPKRRSTAKSSGK